jgi:hypothetical protein
VIDYIFDAEAQAFNLPLLKQELAGYQAAVEIRQTRRLDGTLGAKMLFVSIPDDQDPKGLDDLIAAHDPAKEPTAEQKLAVVAQAFDADLDAAKVKVLHALAIGAKPDPQYVAILEKAAAQVDAAVAAEIAPAPVEEIKPG